MFQFPADLKSSGAEAVSCSWDNCKQVAEIERRFGIITSSLPAPSWLPGTEGIISIADDSQPLVDEILSPDGSLLGDAWKIQPHDLICKTVKGQPVLLGEGRHSVLL